jgi:hypothetical protein
MNSLVPSSGSTSQNRRQSRRFSKSSAADSSEMTGVEGSSRRSPSTRIPWATSSATVTGLLSSFSRMSTAAGAS